MHLTPHYRPHTGRESKEKSTVHEKNLADGWVPPSSSFKSIIHELLFSSSQDAYPTEGDLRTRFYDDYRKEAEGYDRDFIKKHDEDLNTTLIFVRP